MWSNRFCIWKNLNQLVIIQKNPDNFKIIQTLDSFETVRKIGNDLKKSHSFDAVRKRGNYLEDVGQF